MTTQTRLHRLTLYTTELLRHWELSPSDWCVFIHTCSVVDTVGGIRITFTYGCPPPDFFSLLNVSLPYVYSDKDVAVGWRRWHLNYKRRLVSLYWEDDVHVFTQFHSETQFLKGKDLSRPSEGGGSSVDVVLNLQHFGVTSPSPIHVSRKSCSSISRYGVKTC